MTGPRIQSKPHDYDSNPKRFLWSYNFERMKLHFPNNYEELIAMKREYYKQYYARNKQAFNMRRKYKYVLKELKSKF
jgi:hypothetical protein